MQCMDVKPVFEEFIPLNNNKTKNDYSEDGALITAKEAKDSNNCNNNKEKKNWMRSFQLWNTEDDYGFSDHKLDIKRYDEDTFQERKNRRIVGNLDFVVKKEEKDEVPVHGLRLLTSEMNMKRNSTTN